MNIKGIFIAMLVATHSSLASPTEKSANDNYQHSSHKCHHNHHKRIRHMRNQIDKLSLRQKTDHIHIEVLQMAMQKMQHQIDAVIQRTPQRMDSLADEVSKVARNVNIKTEFPETESGDLDSQMEHSTSMEANKLYSKEASTDNKSKNALPNLSKECSKTLAWVVQILPNLQQNIEDLQQSAHLLERMHQQQDSQSKLDYLRKDAASLAHSLTKVSSVAESALVETQVLTLDLERQSENIEGLQTKMMSVVEQISEERDAFDGLLRALPDGILAQYPAQHNQEDEEKNSTLMPNYEKFTNTTKDGNMSDLESENAEPTGSQLDATQRIIHETSGRLESKDSYSGRPYVTSRNSHAPLLPIPKAYDAPTLSFARIRQSSVSLLNAITNLEKRHERSISNLRADLSKVEVNVEKEEQDQATQKEKIRDEQKDVTKVRQDVHLLQHNLRQVERDVEEVAGRMWRLERLKPPQEGMNIRDAAWPTQKGILETRIKRLEEILEKYQRSDKKTKHKHRHKRQRK